MSRAEKPTAENTSEGSEVKTAQMLLSDISVVSQGHTDELWGLDIHPSMEQFVTCSQDKQVHLWDTNSHQPLWSKTIEVRRSELQLLRS